MFNLRVPFIGHLYARVVRLFFFNSNVRALSPSKHLAAIALLAVSSTVATPFANDLYAQRLGSISGVVRDSSGTPLSNVQVLVSGGTRTVLTGENGEFHMRGIASGTYHLDFIRIGYASAHQVAVVPVGGGDVRLEVVMRVVTVRLGSVSVTATPTGSDPLDATQATVQLGGRELQKSLSTSIGQTLSKEPGMSSRFNGPLASTPVIRGLSGERVLVLQDGERTGDLSAAAADHMNAVDPASAERIEVVRGPASLLYGNNALGGVVNVISSDLVTSIPSSFTGFVLAQGESAVRGGVVGAGFTVPLSPLMAFTVRGNIRDVDDLRVGGGGLQANTSGRTGNLSIGGGYVDQSVSVAGAYRGMSFEYGLPFDALAHDDHDEGHGAVRIDGARHTGALQGTWNTGSRVMPSVRVDQTVQSYHHSEIESDGEVGTRFKLGMQTTNITARTRWGRVSGAVGVQGVFRQYDPTGEEAFTPAADNRNLGVFFFQEAALAGDVNDERSPKLQLGARYDHFTIQTRTDYDIERFGSSEKRHFDNVASSVGVSIPLTRVVSLSANVSRGFRAPAVEELFANGFHAAAGTFDIGNPDLNVEQNTGMELGLRAQSSRFSGQMNVYSNRLDGFIVPVASDSGYDNGEDVVPIVTYRGRDAVLTGVEAQFEGTLAPRIVAGIMGDYTHASIRGSSDVIPYMPAARIGGSLRYDNGRVSAGGELRRVFSQERVLNDGLDVPTDAYTLLDLSTGWMFMFRGKQVHSISLRVENALDARYRDATSRIKRFALNPGRNISLSYKVMY